MSEAVKLTPRQAVFIQEYLIDLNATQAALRAGYSEKSAHRIGQENIHKPAIRDAIQKAQDARAARTMVTQDRILQEIARVAFFDPRDLYDDEGRIKSIVDMPDDIRASIARMKMTDFGPEVFMHSKMDALEKLMKHNGMFEKDNAQSVGGPRPIRVQFVEPDNKDAD